MWQVFTVWLKLGVSTTLQYMVTLVNPPCPGRLLFFLLPSPSVTFLPYFQLFFLAHFTWFQPFYCFHTDNYAAPPNDICLHVHDLLLAAVIHPHTVARMESTSWNCDRFQRKQETQFSTDTFKGKGCTFCKICQDSVEKLRNMRKQWKRTRDSPVPW